MRMLEEMFKHWGSPAQTLYPFEVTSIAQWWIESYDQSDKEWDYARDFPSLLPPFENTWLEAAVPNWIIGHNTGVSRRLQRLGARVMSWEVEPKNERDALEHLYHASIIADIGDWPYESVAKLWRDGAQKALDRGEKCRWVVIYQLYQQWEGDKTPFCVAYIPFYLDSAGRAIDLGGTSAIPTLEAVRAFDPPMLQGQPRLDWKNVLEGWLYMATMFFFAIALLHCKNVSIEDVAPPPPAVTKKRAKRGMPQIKFKTLVVEPMRKQIQHEKNADGQDASEIRRALHICRGHFKDYRESPLFGKFADVYWWEPHVRGSAKNGAVIKDYKIKAPK